VKHPIKTIYFHGNTPTVGIAGVVKDHTWEVVQKIRHEGSELGGFDEWVTSNKWKCSVCGFTTFQEDGFTPFHFELTLYEQDCDHQLVERIMKS
jgi:hypothetical protein